MSEAGIIALSTVIATLLATGIPALLGYLQNKLKNEDDSQLTKADLAKKYRDLANAQADENSILEKQSIYLKYQYGIDVTKKEDENKALKNNLDQWMEEVKTNEERHENDILEMKEKQKKELDEFKQSVQFDLQSMKEEIDKLKDYIQRLQYQLWSWNIRPVPQSVEEAKAKGLSLGDFPKQEQK